MTIKTTIYSLNQELNKLSNISLKRSHLYELIAATFGFNSYAALSDNAILINGNRALQISASNMNKVKTRTQEMGYSDMLTEHFIKLIQLVGIDELKFTDLLASFNGNDFDNDEDLDDIDLDEIITNEILDSIRMASDAGKPLANYIMALYFKQIAKTIDADNGVGSNYWYEQMQSGAELSGNQLEWAQQYQQKLQSEQQYQFYLIKAVKLRFDLAEIRLAKEFGDTSFFDKQHDTNANPMRVAEIAEILGRPKDHHKWLTKSAEAGNVDAMRKLINMYDSEDLLRCWTWVYFSKLVDKDLTLERYYGMHDDGSAYDDDVGGTLHVGGEGGIELATLDSVQDLLARDAAEKLLQLMSVTKRM